MGETKKGRTIERKNEKKGKGNEIRIKCGRNTVVQNYRCDWSI
jgi:hypothetical protein